LPLEREREREGGREREREREREKERERKNARASVPRSNIRATSAETKFREEFSIKFPAK